MTPELKFENEVMLSVVQALIGAVRPEVVAITIATSKESVSVDLYFLATEIRDELREIVDEVETDLDALLAGAARIVSHLDVGDDWTDSTWTGRHHRAVFARSAQE